MQRREAQLLERFRMVEQDGEPAGEQGSEPGAT
jgi:hypothetical protein